MDELAYSLNGENFHYGTPKNPKAPGRIPGGSSSGSAAVVAGGLADFALGTDCGGSVRIPASYCGLYGIRTSHGRVATDGIVPFASSFDTVGWFTRAAPLLRQVGDMLLPDAAPFRPKRLLVAADAFAAMDPEVREALGPACRRLTAAFAEVQDVSVYADGSADVAAAFRVLQGSEIAANHGPWIDRYQPTFGPGVRERFLWTRTIAPADVAKASIQCERVSRHLEDLLDGGALLCLPTAPGVAPRLQTPPAELDAFRARAFALLAIAGLARLPQVNLPLGTLAGCPLGISLLAPHGGDRGLLDWVAAQFP
jgi:amidase